MKLITIPILAAFVLTGLSSCIKTNVYDTQPVSTGYQYSFSDEFNYDAHNWSFSDGVNRAQVYVSNGQLNYNYHPSANGTNTVAINTGWDRTLRNWDLQTRLSSDNGMAVVWGVSNSDNGYSLFIDNRGYFAVYDEGTSSIAPAAIINWTQNTAIRNGWNDIEVEQTGNTWTGFINGTQVFSIAAHTLYGDKIGYEVLANTNGSADYLDVRW